MEEAFLGLYNVQLKFRFRLGKFILYANIPYLYPHTPNHPNKLGGPWGIGGFGEEAYEWYMAFEKSRGISLDLGKFPDLI